MEQSKIVKRISQLQETLATQHTKIYLADDELILSGANLETAYFTNRQDRYIQVIHLFFGNSFSRKKLFKSLFLVLKSQTEQFLLNSCRNHRKAFIFDAFS